MLLWLISSYLNLLGAYRVPPLGRANPACPLNMLRVSGSSLRDSLQTPEYSITGNLVPGREEVQANPRLSLANQEQLWTMITFLSLLCWPRVNECALCTACVHRKKFQVRVPNISEFNVLTCPTPQWSVHLSVKAGPSGFTVLLHGFTTSASPQKKNNWKPSGPATPSFTNSHEPHLAKPKQPAFCSASNA